MRFDRALIDVDLYGVLGVPPDATREHIRRAYRRLASVSHPDLNPTDAYRAERRMAQINVAAGILLDPIRRSLYDRMRADRSPDWTAPTRHAPPVEYEHVRLDQRELEWIERLRTRAGRNFFGFEAWIMNWSPEFRMMFLCASVALAVGLIRFARPTSLPDPFEPERPVAVAETSPIPT